MRGPIHRLASHLRAAGYDDASRNLPATIGRRGLPCTRLDRGDRILIQATGLDGAGLSACVVDDKGRVLSVVATDQALLSKRPGDDVDAGEPMSVLAMRVPESLMRALQREGAEALPPRSPASQARRILQAWLAVHQ